MIRNKTPSPSCVPKKIYNEMKSELFLPLFVWVSYSFLFPHQFQKSHFGVFYIECLQTRTEEIAHLTNKNWRKTVRLANHTISGNALKSVGNCVPRCIDWSRSRDYY